MAAKLTPEKLHKIISKNLFLLEEMSFLEQYAVFMGKAQLIELMLCGLLVKNYNYNEKSAEKYTLGKLIKEAKKCGLRPDFVKLLKELLEYRNSLAHEFLGLTVVGSKLIGSAFKRLQHKELRDALYKVEEVVQVYDFLSINNQLVNKVT